MCDELIKILSLVDQPTELCRYPDGTRVLILPYGGRVLGLYTSESDKNFYWTHPSLTSVESARAFYRSQEWHNSGGDRTWLSPEVDFFFPDFPKLDKYWQPRELDPGDYKMVRTADGFLLVNRLTLVLSRTKQKVELEITKSIEPAADPRRYEPALSELLDVQYAGYIQHTSLEMVGGSEPGTPQVGLWNLLQLPHEGELLVPTYVRPAIRFLIGAVVPEDLIVHDHLVRYKMRALGCHKIGIRAVATAGRAGYTYSDGDQFALIIRNFSVNPSGEYVDVPWNSTEDMGYCAQACNFNISGVRFSELEYHVPAIGNRTGRTRCVDTSEVWAFRGSWKDIQTLARSLLSAEV